MRQPAIPAALKALLDAVPDEALRPLVLELLLSTGRSINGSSASAPAGAPRQRKRRRGWPKGKPRGRRPSTRASGLGPHHEGLPPKARAAAAIAAHPEKTNRAIAAEIGVSVQTVWRARAEAKAAAKAAAPARRGKPRDLRSGGSRGPGRPRKEINPGLDAKILAKRKREAQRLRVKRAAAKQNKAAAKAPKAAGNGNTGVEASASATPTQAFWRHAEALAPTAPYKAVANEFGTNLAQAKDCYRKAVLPPGMSSSAVERFLELAPPRPAPPMAPHP